MSIQDDLFGERVSVTINDVTAEYEPSEIKILKSLSLTREQRARVHEIKSIFEGRVVSGSHQP